MGQKKSVTIRDVAKKAGVSPGTVSRAINNSPLVNEETQRRIMEVVRELNYTPHPIAQRLSLGKTLAIAVILPFFTRPSAVERLKGVVSCLSQTKYDLVIHSVETAEQRATCFNTIPHREQADGVLIISLVPRGDEEEHLANANIPVVLIDADHPNLPMLHQIVVDDVAGGQAATEYLVELGHTKIGFIGDPIENSFNFVSSRNRYQGYRAAHGAVGLPLRPEYYLEGQHGRHEAREMGREILSLPDPPTAIFAASDTQAIGVLEAARDLGVSVPEDLSVIGYDDIELAEILDLTTMRQLLLESGQRGAELLLETLSDPAIEPIRQILPTELVVRSTTAPPSG